jgi:uncharacterized protein YndB with AHSA1/START domain
MPIKNDETGKRWVEIETIVPGTPEQVWQAIATGPGVAAWYVKAQIDEHVGGKIVLDFGANGTATGEVTVWEPPRRFGYIEREWREGAPPLATEITVIGRSGARCVIRMVHSLFASTNDWDDQLENYESGWPGFFEVLRLYLAHFTGAKAACFHVMGSVKGDQPETWKRLTELLRVQAQMSAIAGRRNGPRGCRAECRACSKAPRTATSCCYSRNLGPGSHRSVRMAFSNLQRRISASASTFMATKPGNRRPRASQYGSHGLPTPSSRAGADRRTTSARGEAAQVLIPCRPLGPGGRPWRTALDARDANS